MTNDKFAVDFLIVGAQKAGTTSLFKYLESHPDICMPTEKESGFFSLEERYGRGWNWYLTEFFGEAAVDKLWGEASPHYLADPRAAGRIKAQLPRVGLIAILRHPIDRALSHHKMIVRRGVEGRSFDKAAHDLMQDKVAREARKMTADKSNPEDSCYLAWSEYGRMLETFLEHFERKQLLVLFTEEMEQDPQRTLDTVMQFLGLEPGFVPANLGKKYHLGGSQQRFPRLRSALRRTPLRIVWRLLSNSVRGYIEYWYNQRNVIPEPTNRTEVDSGLRTSLVNFFRSDVRHLESIVGRQVPWPEFVDLKEDRASVLRSDRGVLRDDVDKA